MANIAGLNKTQLLAGLYNRAAPQGMGFLNFDKNPMTEEVAQEIISSSGRLYFDYLKGRVMKIGLDKDEMETRLYNRDNGANAAEEVVEAVRAGSSVDPEKQKAVLREAAEVARQGMTKGVSTGKGHIGDVPCDVTVMGLADVEDILAPKVDEALED